MNQQDFTPCRLALEPGRRGHLPEPGLPAGSLASGIPLPPVREPVRFQVKKHVVPVWQANHKRLDITYAVKEEHVTQHDCRLLQAPISCLAGNPQRPRFRGTESRLIEYIPGRIKLICQVIFENSLDGKLHRRHFHPRYDADRISHPAFIPGPPDPLCQVRQVRPHRVEGCLRWLDASHLVATGTAKPIGRDQPTAGSGDQLVVVGVRQAGQRGSGYGDTIFIDQVLDQLIQLPTGKSKCRHANFQPGPVDWIRSGNRTSQCLVCQLVPHAIKRRREHGRQQ